MSNRYRIKKGWMGEGKECSSLGESVKVNGQEWMPVLFDDEEDPTHFKSSALEPIPDTPPAKEWFVWDKYDEINDVKELRHIARFWANSNQANRDLWKRCNYERIALTREVEQFKLFKEGTWSDEDMVNCWCAAVNLVEWMKEKTIQEKCPKPPTREEFMKLLKASKQSQQRKPLFRTEDGKDIFEGEPVWYLSFIKKENGYKLCGGPFKIESVTYKDLEISFSEMFFSTKEAAEAYIKSQPTIHHGEDDLQHIASQPETGYPTIDRQEQKRDWEIIDPYLADNKEIIIRSVRRLTDNQVFSVGENVITKGCVVEQTISSFDVLKENTFPDRMRVGFTEGFGTDFSNLKKVLTTKQPSPSNTDKNRIEVEIYEQQHNGQYFEVHFKKCTDWISQEKFPLIKNAIEALLNNIEFHNIPGVQWDKTVIGAEKIYTKSEYEEAIRKAFEAARFVHPLAGMRYDTFEDYLKTIK